MSYIEALDYARQLADQRTGLVPRSTEQNWRLLVSFLEVKAESQKKAALATPAQEHAAQLACQGRDLEVTDEMALAFHRAISDGAIGQDDVDEIKDGLRAAFCNIAAPAQVQEDAQEDAQDAVRALIATHAEILEDNAYAYFELAYTRQTGWMAWITDKPLYGAPVVNPDRKVLAKGQGDTPDEACADAARAAQGGAA